MTDYLFKMITDSKNDKCNIDKIETRIISE